MTQHPSLALPAHARRARFWGALTGQLAGALAAIMLLALVAGCGGGGGAPASTPAPNAGITGLTQGAIDGFGSIVVNGVRFDDSGAQVFDDHGGLRGSPALKLGMQVEVEHGDVAGLEPSARAHVIRFGEAVRGPVAAVDVAGSALTVLGQRVVIGERTVFDSSLAGGLASVAVGTVVEVHGLFDAAANVVRASRIEASPGATSYRLRGAVAGLNTTARTFNVGSAAISYANASDVPAGLANGMVVRVKLETAQVAGLWVATEVKGGPVRPADRMHAELRGIITAFTSATQFSVNGIAVDAANAAFPDGSAALALGVMVEVEGRIVDGVVVATKVEIEDRHRGDDNRRFSLHGDITALDSVAKTLVVKGTLVRYSGAVYINGTEANLALGVRVQAKGVLAADRLAVQALTIRFDK